MGGGSDGTLPQLTPPLSTHANSTNICPIRTLVRHEMVSSLSSTRFKRSILILSSRSYAAAIYAYFER